MFVRMLKDVDCKSSYSYDREPLDKWSNVPDIRRAIVAHHFNAGEVVEAVQIKPSGGEAAHCVIQLDNESEREYSGVPWVAIEILRDDPRSEQVM